MTKRSSGHTRSKSNARPVILLCRHCGQEHGFKTLQEAIDCDCILPCDKCGKYFIEFAIKRLLTFRELMKKNPAAVRPLVSQPGGLEQYLRGLIDLGDAIEDQDRA